MLFLIGLGANLGDRQENIKFAIDHLKSRNKVLSQASLYETPPIGTANRLFLNTAVMIESNLTPSDLMADLLWLEKRLGRIRRQHWGNRELDCDILMALDDEFQNPVALSTKTVTLPHPEMLKRDFVMVPASEIAPNWPAVGTRETLRSYCNKMNFSLSIWQKQRSPRPSSREKLASET